MRVFVAHEKLTASEFIRLHETNIAQQLDIKTNLQAPLSPPKRKPTSYFPSIKHLSMFVLTILIQEISNKPSRYMEVCIEHKISEPIRGLGQRDRI